MCHFFQVFFPIWPKKKGRKKMPLKKVMKNSGNCLHFLEQKKLNKQNAVKSACEGCLIQSFSMSYISLFLTNNDLHSVVYMLPILQPYSAQPNGLDHHSARRSYSGPRAWHNSWPQKTITFWADVGTIFCLINERCLAPFFFIFLVATLFHFCLLLFFLFSY